MNPVLRRALGWSVSAVAALSASSTLSGAGCTLFLADDPSIVLCDSDAECPADEGCKSGFCKPLDPSELPFVVVDAGGEGEGDAGEGEGDVGEGEGDVGEGEGEGDVGEGEGDVGEGEGEPPPPPPRTCREQLAREATSPSGRYGLDLTGDGVVDGEFFCEMTRDGGGWTRVVLLDDTDPAFACPVAWRSTALPDGRIGCARPSGGASQASVRFSVPHDFSEVGGRVTGVVFGDQDTFVNHVADINGVFVDGVSLTTGPATAREHVFTFVGAHPFVDQIVNRCPCEQGAVQPPAFVDAFFCDKPTANGARPGGGRAYDTAHPVWEGPDVCNVADVDGYFARALPRTHAASDELELRIMADQNTDQVSNPDENVALVFVELYVR
jgi:hypothetical protein